MSGLDGGFVEATNEMAMNVTFHENKSTRAGEVKVLVSPVADVQNASMTVRLGRTSLCEIRDVQLVAMHPLSYTIPVEDIEQARKELSVKMQSAQGKVLLRWTAASPVDGNVNLATSSGKPLQTEISVTAQTPLEKLYRNGVFLEKRGDTQGAMKVYNQVLLRDRGTFRRQI